MIEEKDGPVIYRVSELTSLMKEMLEEEYPSVWVEGEISNLVTAASGHVYFSVKDERAQLPSVMFRSASSRLVFEPENGMKVIARGRVSIYPPSGRYQLIVSGMKPAGVGVLHLEFEELKQRLDGEGLFDEALKKPLPPFPHRIGVITSPRGAAVRDIISIIGRRFPVAEIVLYPVNVQGEGASTEISRAIEVMDRPEELDLLIVGRGGGSIEDLWAFNEENVARAIVASKLPVVSAVGHEIDFTIADFVSDLRAPTPSAAAELVVPDIIMLLSRLNGLSASMRREVRAILDRMVSRFKFLSSSHGLRRVPLMIEDASQRLDHCQLAMRKNVLDIFRGMRRRLEDARGRLDILSPAATLGRGYSIAYRLPECALLRSASELSRGDAVRVRLHRGEVDCEVTKVHVHESGKAVSRK